MKFLFALFALFLIPGSAIALMDGLRAIANNREIWIPLLIGVLPGVVTAIFIIRWLPVISTFVHELTHALFALLFFRSIEKFVVTFRKGGYMIHSQGFGGEFGNLVITAAPYFFPTIPMLAVIFLPFQEPQIQRNYLILIGATLMLHLIVAAHDIRSNWSKGTFIDAGGTPSRTDIGKMGYISAFLAITGLTLFSLDLMFFMIIHGYSGLWQMLKLVVTSSWKIYSELIILLVPMIAAIFEKFR